MMGLLAIAVFASAMVIDFAEARYVLAVEERNAHRAAAWSLVMWALGCFGFVAVLDCSLWLMIPEGLGFYCGTRLALRPRALTRWGCSAVGHDPSVGACDVSISAPLPPPCGVPMARSLSKRESRAQACRRT